MKIIHSKPNHNIFLAFIALCFAASCVSDPGVKPRENGVEVRFATSGLTRTAVTTDINTEGSRFAVYGDMKNLTSGNATSPVDVIFSMTEVLYSGSAWTYDRTQYWFPDHEYSFVALHPTSVLTSPDAHPGYADSQLDCTYTIPTSDGVKINRLQLADIIAATHRRAYNSDLAFTATPVRLHFFHTMARVNFSISYEGTPEQITITGIEFEGVNKTGTLRLTPAALDNPAGQTDDYTLLWTHLTGKGTLVADLNADVANGETRSLFPAEDALFMIPQPDNHDIGLKIKYIDNQSGTMEEQVLTAETPIGGWEAGTVYSYAVTVNLVTEDVVMNLTVSVSDWKEEDPTDVPVPRK